MPTQSSRVRQFGRRVDWSREEWIVAWDACPKKKQSYGPADRNVREVAHLINRTPSAVSHSFGNLWYVWTDGRHGARNGSRLCREVVDFYRQDPEVYHKAALVLRTSYLETSISPRIELRERGGSGLLQPQLSRSLSAASGMPRQGLIIYNRQGTVLDGIVLNAEILGAAILAGVGYTIGSRLVKLVERALKRHRRTSPQPILITRTKTWQALADGSESEFEDAILSRYLPELVEVEATVRQRRVLAGYVLVLLGVRRLGETETAKIAGSPRPPSRARIGQLERAIGTSLKGLEENTLVALDQLARGAESKAFRKTFRGVRNQGPGLVALDQKSLDEFQ